MEGYQQPPGGYQAYGPAQHQPQPQYLQQPQQGMPGATGPRFVEMPRFLPSAQNIAAPNMAHMGSMGVAMAQGGSQLSYAPAPILPYGNGLHQVQTGSHDLVAAGPVHATQPYGYMPMQLQPRPASAAPQLPSLPSTTYDGSLSRLNRNGAQAVASSSRGNTAAAVAQPMAFYPDPRQYGAATDIPGTVYVPNSLVPQQLAASSSQQAMSPHLDPRVVPTQSIPGSPHVLHQSPVPTQRAGTPSARDALHQQLVKKQHQQRMLQEAVAHSQMGQPQTGLQLPSSTQSNGATRGARGSGAQRKTHAQHPYARPSDGSKAGSSRQQRLPTSAGQMVQASIQGNGRSQVEARAHGMSHTNATTPATISTGPLHTTSGANSGGLHATVTALNAAVATSQSAASTASQVGGGMVGSQNQAAHHVPNGNNGVANSGGQTHHSQTTSSEAAGHHTAVNGGVISTPAAVNNALHPINPQATAAVTTTAPVATHNTTILADPAPVLPPANVASALPPPAPSTSTGPLNPAVPGPMAPSYGAQPVTTQAATASPQQPILGPWGVATGPAEYHPPFYDHGSVAAPMPARQHGGFYPSNFSNNVDPTLWNPQNNIHLLGDPPSPEDTETEPVDIAVSNTALSSNLPYAAERPESIPDFITHRDSRQLGSALAAFQAATPRPAHAPAPPAVAPAPAPLAVPPLPAPPALPPAPALPAVVSAPALPAPGVPAPAPPAPAPPALAHAPAPAPATAPAPGPASAPAQAPPQVLQPAQPEIINLVSSDDEASGHEEADESNDVDSLFGDYESEPEAPTLPTPESPHHVSAEPGASSQPVSVPTASSSGLGKPTPSVTEGVPHPQPAPKTNGLALPNQAQNHASASRLALPNLPAFAQGPTPSPTPPQVPRMVPSLQPMPRPLPQQQQQQQQALQNQADFHGYQVKQEMIQQAAQEAPLGTHYGAQLLGHQPAHGQVTQQTLYQQGQLLAPPQPNNFHPQAGPHHPQEGTPPRSRLPPQATPGRTQPQQMVPSPSLQGYVHSPVRGRKTHYHFVRANEDVVVTSLVRDGNQSAPTCNELWYCEEMRDPKWLNKKARFIVQELQQMLTNRGLSASGSKRVKCETLAHWARTVNAEWVKLGQDPHYSPKHDKRTSHFVKWPAFQPSPLDDVKPRISEAASSQRHTPNVYQPARAARFEGARALPASSNSMPQLPQPRPAVNQTHSLPALGRSSYPMQGQAGPSNYQQLLGVNGGYVPSPAPVGSPYLNTLGQPTPSTSSQTPRGYTASPHVAQQVLSNNPAPVAAQTSDAAPAHFGGLSAPQDSNTVKQAIHPWWGQITPLSAGDVPEGVDQTNLVGFNVKHLPVFGDMIHMRPEEDEYWWRAAPILAARGATHHESNEIFMGFANSNAGVRYFAKKQAIAKRKQAETMASMQAKAAQAALEGVQTAPRQQKRTAEHADLDHREDGRKRVNSRNMENGSSSYLAASTQLPVPNGHVGNSSHTPGAPTRQKRSADDADLDEHQGESKRTVAMMATGASSSGAAALASPYTEGANGTPYYATQASGSAPTPASNSLLLGNLQIPAAAGQSVQDTAFPAQAMPFQQVAASPALLSAAQLPPAPSAAQAAATPQTHAPPAPQMSLPAGLWAGEGTSTLSATQAEPAVNPSAEEPVTFSSEELDEWYRTFCRNGSASQTEQAGPSAGEGEPSQSQPTGAPSNEELTPAANHTTVSEIPNPDVAANPSTDAVAYPAAVFEMVADMTEAEFDTLMAEAEMIFAGPA